MSEALAVEPRGLAMRVPAGSEWTYADLAALPGDTRGFEIVEGGLHVAPRPTRPHQYAALLLATVLRTAASPGFVVLPEIDVDLGRNVFEPDIVVIHERAYKREGPLRAIDLVLAVPPWLPTALSFKSDSFELDEKTIPQEAFLERDAVSFTKGCFLGQELVCRIDTRGRVNRYLRRLTSIVDGRPPRGSEIVSGDKVVGTVTSSVASADVPASALGYVRHEVDPPAEVQLRWDGGTGQAVVEALPAPA